MAMALGWRTNNQCAKKEEEKNKYVTIRG